jgi:hypothetical protein
MMKKLYLSLLAISIAFASGASAQVAVAPQHAPSAYWLVPISQAQAPPVVPWHAPPVAPEANGTLPYWWRVTSTTQEDNLDRLVASATTLGEIRALLSNAARLELIRRDPLLTAFIRERIAAPASTRPTASGSPRRSSATATGSARPIISRPSRSCPPSLLRAGPRSGAAASRPISA